MLSHNLQDNSLTSWMSVYNSGPWWYWYFYWVINNLFIFKKSNVKVNTFKASELIQLKKTFFTRINHLVDKFSYLGSSVSSTENDINMRLVKAWTAIDRLKIIWKSNFFPSSGGVNSTVWMHHTDANWAYWEKTWRQLHKNVTNYIEQILAATSCKTGVRPPTSYL